MRRRVTKRVLPIFDTRRADQEEEKFRACGSLHWDGGTWLGGPYQRQRGMTDGWMYSEGERAVHSFLGLITSYEHFTLK